jgi:hypothetical protein
VGDAGLTLDALEVDWFTALDQCADPLVSGLGLGFRLCFRGRSQDRGALFADVGGWPL